jgi:PRTRC genetic system protein D
MHLPNRIQHMNTPTNFRLDSHGSTSSLDSSTATNNQPERRPLLARIGADIGYGHTKLCIPVIAAGEAPAMELESNRFETTSFPSVVILHRGVLASCVTLSDSPIESIDDGSACYLYGHSAVDSDDGSSGRALDHQFANSADYGVLVRACLQRHGYPLTTERLVLGVPFDRVQAAAATLRNRFTGTVLVNGRECDIRNVQVVAQPVAAFLWQLHQTQNILQRTLAQYACLTIDVGYRTIDWACTRGLKIIDPRCGSAPGGVHRLVRSISDMLSHRAGEDCSSFSMRMRIETALRDSAEFIDVGTRRFKMSDYSSLLQGLIEQSLLPIVESIGNAADITDVHVVGGGCSLYSSALERRFPNKRILAARDPQFAVARGLHLLACRVGPTAT